MAADLFAVVDGAVNPAPSCVVEHRCHPRGQGRPRGRIISPRSGRPFVNFYKAASDREYEEALSGSARAAMRDRPVLIGPLAIRIFAMMPIAVSWPSRDRDAALAGTKFHTSAPDCDNLGKAVLDAFNGIVFADDKQIVRMMVMKEYAEVPGIIAEVYQLP